MAGRGWDLRRKQNQTKPSPLALQRSEGRQGVAGAALAPGNKGSGRGQPGEKPLRIGREGAQLGKQCCSWGRSKRGDGANSCWCGNHNKGPDQSQWRKSHTQAAGENTREGCGPRGPPVVGVTPASGDASAHIPRPGHSAAQLRTRGVTSRPSRSKHTLLVSLQISWCCYFASSTFLTQKSNLFVCFSTLLDWKHLITLSPAPRKLPATEWWVVDGELELGNNITPGFVNPRTLTKIPHRFLSAQHADI